MVLLDTTADPEPEQKQNQKQKKGPCRRLEFIGHWLSFRLAIKPLMKIMFGRSLLEEPGRAEVRAKWKIICLARTAPAPAGRHTV